jgi:hypothetical protein
LGPHAPQGTFITTRLRMLQRQFPTTAGARPCTARARHPFLLERKDSVLADGEECSWEPVEAIREPWTKRVDTKPFEKFKQLSPAN